MDELVTWLTLLAALGCGLISGVFFAFSTFVMKALGRIPPPSGISAMQSINVVVINPAFVLAFLGTGAACVLLIIASVQQWDRPAAAYLLAGSVIYLIGTVLVTFVCNVPRNEALAAVDPMSDEAARYWAGYVRTWTTWNHVRTLAALAAAATLTLALRAHIPGTGE